MSLGLAVFASVVLILAVYNQAFRKVLLRFVGVAVAIGIIGAAGWYGYERYQDYRIKKQWTLVQLEPSKAGPWDAVSRFDPATNSMTLLIHGGETLEYVPSNESDKLSAGLVPIIYLGHHQKFFVACGQINDRKHTAARDNNGTLTCE